MVKPRHHDIQWDLCFSALRMDGGGDSEKGLLVRARKAFETQTLHILTAGFLQRCEETAFAVIEGMEMDNPSHVLMSLPMLPEGVFSGAFQIEHDVDAQHGPALATLVYVEGERIVTLPLPTGGFLMFDMQLGDVYVPSAFDYQRERRAALQYAAAICTSIKSFEMLRRLPTATTYKEVPSLRVVRNRKTVRQPPYRVSAMMPGIDKTVLRAFHEDFADNGRQDKRAAPVEHEVRGHWRHFGVDGNCDHEWQDISTPEVVKREHCVNCKGRRTLLAAGRRGDPTKKDARQKLVVVK